MFLALIHSKWGQSSSIYLFSSFNQQPIWEYFLSHSKDFKIVLNRIITAEPWGPCLILIVRKKTQVSLNILIQETIRIEREAESGQSRKKANKLGLQDKRTTAMVQRDLQKTQHIPTLKGQNGLQRSYLYCWLYMFQLEGNSNGTQADFFFKTYYIRSSPHF